MLISTVVLFSDEREIDLSNLEEDIKKTLKEKNVSLEDVEKVHAYVRPEAVYLAAETSNGLVDFNLYEE